MAAPPATPPPCPACHGKGWVTPSIKMYPGDRVACSRCAPQTTPPRTLATHAELVTIAAKWLKRQGCNVVLAERNAGGECPDAIGWYCAGFSSTVVECKVSVADFRRDFLKEHRGMPAMGDMRWFLAPKGLLTSEKLPGGWGLLEWTGKIVRVAREADHLVGRDRRDIREEARLLLSELRIYHAQGIEYRKGSERWDVGTKVVAALPSIGDRNSTSCAQVLDSTGSALLAGSPRETP